MDEQKKSIMASLFIFSVAITLIDAFADFKKLFVFRKKGILTALFLGPGVYVVILGVYFLTRNIIEYSNVTSSLTEGMGITAIYKHSISKKR